MYVRVRIYYTRTIVHTLLRCKHPPPLLSPVCHVFGMIVCSVGECLGNIPDLVYLSNQGPAGRTLLGSGSTDSTKHFTV